MRSVSCNLCGADDYAVLFPRSAGASQPHQIVKCRRCGLMYANPQEVVDCDTFATGEQVFDPRYFEKQYVQLPDSLKALRVLNELFPQRGKLLEVGSHRGILLDRCRAAGWEVTGLDPDRPAVAYARSTYHLNVFLGVLPHPELPAATFDAAIMLHVIEHMPDPGASLRELRRLLKPGAVLVVETQRFDSLMFRILGKHDRGINNCPGHIYFFTTTTLRRLLEQAGFSAFRTDLVGRTLTLDRLLVNLGYISRSPRILRWMGRLGNAVPGSRLRLYLNLRDMQRVYARAI